MNLIPGFGSSEEGKDGKPRATEQAKANAGDKPGEVGEKAQGFLPNVHLPSWGNSGASKSTGQDGGEERGEEDTKSTGGYLPSGYIPNMSSLGWPTNEDKPGEYASKFASEDQAKKVAAQRAAAIEAEKNRPSGPAYQGHNLANNDHSLTSILDTDHRSELTLLIASATASMRKSIESNFDATASLRPDLIKELTSEDDKILNPNIDPGKVDVESFDRERKLKAQREKELSAPAMKELKEACLNFFDEWRSGVIQRVGEVVNSKETASKHMHDKTTTAKTPHHEPGDKKVDPESDSGPHSSSASAGKTNDEPSSLTDLYPPVSTPLARLARSKRILIVHSMLLLLISLEHYIAPSRILLLYLTSSLHLDLSVLTEDEEKVARGLLEAAKELSGESEAQAKADANKSNRKWKVGLASVAGAAVIGITGGMAAPLVAAGVGSVMGGLGLGATAAAGYLGSVAGSTLLVGGLFGAYGGRMTGQMMDKYAKEVEDFAFEPVSGRVPEKAVDKEQSQDNKAVEEKKKKKQDPKDEKPEEKAAMEQDPEARRLRVTIGISGWLTDKDEVVKPWAVIGKGAEVFALRWELEALMNLGNSMKAMVSSAAWGYAQSEIVKRTIFAELMGAMWPIGLLKVSRVVDNPFSVAKSRAEKAGEVLADALINKAQGERPVTLIGYSLGARVIYQCLMSLAKRKAFGLVESVVLIGAPTPSTTSEWRVMRSVVSGRLVNVYSENDYVLGFLYRTSSIQYGIAGLQKIEGLPSVENVDVSETVSGHLRYRFLVGSILKKIGFEDVVPEEVAKEEEELKKMDEEEKNRNYVKEAREQIPDVKDVKMPNVPMGLGRKSGEVAREDATVQGKDQTANPSPKTSEHDDDAEKEADKMEREVKEKTQKSMLQWGVEKLYIGKPSAPAPA
ncbi:hypothetical protein MMC09_003667 [Bachmanniomyces sp. S44760]|nr:hypothetical protein [Bachmanniomyces sp. S44760]